MSKRPRVGSDIVRKLEENVNMKDKRRKGFKEQV